MHPIERRSMQRHLLSALALTSLAFTGCLFDGSGGGEVGASSQSLLTIPYVVSGDKIITAAHTDTSHWCDGDSLVTDTSIQQGDTVRYSISGNILSILSHPDTLETSGAVVQRIYKGERVGGSGGLEGKWKSLASDYTILSGTPTASEIANLEKEKAGQSGLDKYADAYIEFAGGKISTYLDVDNAQLFLDQWSGRSQGDTTGGMNTRYDIEAKAVDKNTVQLKGNKTGEIVTMKFTSLGDRTVTSTDPKHKTFAYRQEPESCPEEIEPQWYSLEFLVPNAKVPVKLGKFGANEANFPKAKGFRGFPLKFRAFFLN